MRLTHLAVAGLVAVPFTTTSLAAQGYPESVQRALENCRDQDRSDRGRVCEVRTIAVPRGTRALDIDGRRNGGVRVTGWDRDSIAVFAVVHAHARDQADAQRIAAALRVSAENGRIRTGGTPPEERNSGYAVSYHVFAPRTIDVEARTQNGGISVDGIAGRVDVVARNGGLAIRNAGGDVRGRTTNGGITLSLSGAQWNGRGVDLETTNGGVTVTLPTNFNAELEASTVNGGFTIDYPLTMQGRIGRRITATLGRGGPPVRVRTTNGGVRIRGA